MLKLVNSHYQEASAAISGADVYGKLKFESGIHRVQVLSHLPNSQYMADTRNNLLVSLLQRVPVTEKSGRVHTSAVSVAILPQADEVLTF